jgi:hypothetical protein
VPGYDTNETKDEHFWTGLNNCFDSDEIEKRLFRKYRIYKSHFYL